MDQVDLVLHSIAPEIHPSPSLASSIAGVPKTSLAGVFSASSADDVVVGSSGNELVSEVGTASLDELEDDAASDEVELDDEGEGVEEGVITTLDVVGAGALAGGAGLAAAGGAGLGATLGGGLKAKPFALPDLLSFPVCFAKLLASCGAEPSP